jgi:hypothetical protein
MLQILQQGHRYAAHYYAGDEFEKDMT